MTTQMTLIDRIENREATVGIIGLGYVGLPLALAFVDAGFRVIGIDVDERKVHALQRGESYVEDVPPQALADLGDRFTATTDFAALAHCQAVSICVPTPLGKSGDPDISYIVRASEEIAPYVHRGMLVVLESTTYPGTTTEVLLPRLTADRPDLRVGEGFFLCFSPERVDPGRRDWTTRNTPKVIGGVTPACLRVGMALYGAAVQPMVPVSSTGAAEMAKLLENTFRAVNIGLANEVLLMCDKLGLDVWEVVDAAATKPFGFMKFTPGPGLGGHCIPIDPLYLSWKLKSLDYHARFIHLASQVNAEMPHYWVERVQDALNEAGKPVKGSRVLVLGAAYKKDVGDVRESPALDILRLLSAKGAYVRYHDPHVPEVRVGDTQMVSADDLERGLREADCVLVVTDHSDYDWRHVRETAQLVVDARGVVARAGASLLPVEVAEPARIME